MAGRAYRRDKNGRFAGSGGGTTVTYGKAGGFANAAFRGRVAASRASRPSTQGGSKMGKARGSKSSSRFKGVKALSKKAGKKALVGGLTVGAGVAGSALAVKALNGSSAFGTKKVKSGAYSGLGVGRREVVSMPRTALRNDALVGGRSVRSGAFVGQAASAAKKSTGTKVTPNYNLAKGNKEYVGRRLKPGEGRGFKLAGI